MSAMLGVVQSDNVISLYLFWELTSISSFLLIGYWNTRDGSRFGALKSMMITVFRRADDAWRICSVGDYGGYIFHP